MTEKALLVYDDHLSRPGVVVTASSESGDHVADNLRDMRPGRSWAGLTASEWVKVDLGATRTTDLLGFFGFTKASLEATVRVRLGASEAAVDADAAPYDQTHDLWPPLFGLGDNLGNAFGGYVAPTSLEAARPARLIRLGAQHEHRWMRLDFADPGAAQAVMGKVYASYGIQFARNFSLGWEEDEESSTTHEVTDGGAVLPIPGAVLPVRAFEFRGLRRSEALTLVQDMKRIAERLRPVIALPFPSASPAVIARTMIYGLIRSSSRTAHPRFDRATVRIEIVGLI